MPDPAPPSPTLTALRVATACTVTLVLAEWWHLTASNQAVWTTGLVMLRAAPTSFQRGLERVFGRGLGILLGLCLVTLFGQTPVLVLFAEVAVLIVLFYVQLSGRMMYTFLNAGLYTAAIVEIGHAQPATVATEAAHLFAAICTGVAVADLVTWVSGAEADLSIEPGGEPLFPVRPDWVSHSGMLAVTAILTQLGCRAFGLPAGPTVVSVMVLAVSPDLASAIQKGEMRVLGVAMGVAWAVVATLVVMLAPHFPVFAAFIFAGVFVSGYISAASPKYTYAGYQTVIVLPMLLVVPPHEFGDLAAAGQRLLGVGVAVLACVLVAAVWPWHAPPPAPPPPSDTESR